MAFNQFPQKGGIPSGNTAGRPSAPVVGDTYYNGQLEILEIWNGSAWVANSAPPATPTVVSVTDSGTGLSYAGGGTFTVVVAPGAGGATPLQYGIVTDSGGFSASSSGTTLTLSGLTSGVLFGISANASNNFGTTVNSSPFTGVVASTVPQTPTVVATPGATSISYAMTGSNGGKAITNYSVSTDGVTYTALSPAQTGPVVITGLSEATSYTYYFKAINANGSSISSAAVTSTTRFSVEYVVVGGGAGATGYYYTGGGGSGSMLTGSVTGSTGVAYSVKVGAGGAQQNGPGGDGNPGTTSIFSTFVAEGGKGGAVSTAATYTGGTIATTTQGGGSGGGGQDINGSAGGGGGMGAAGTSGNSTGTIAGNGGVGLSTSISGSSVFYAGGGGGSVYANAGRGTGGNGGGGNGSKGANGGIIGTAGTANTGGGGGGASHNALGAEYGYGYAGGSGRVILKLVSGITATFSGGVTQTNTTSSGYKIYQITAAGTGDTVTFS
jgi:hypothetical protein